jgi:hypothetical protein
VLLMMAKGTDTGLGEYADHHPGAHESQVLDEKEYEKM